MANLFIGHMQVASANTAQRVYSSNDAAKGNRQYRIYVWPTQYTMRFATNSLMSDGVYVVNAQKFCLGVGNPYDFWVDSATGGSYYGLWLVPVDEDVGQL